MATAGAHLNILNIQVIAKDQLVEDRANGTYDHNVASFEKYYLVFGEHQVEPYGYSPNLIEGITTAMPMVNTFRITFSDHSFDSEGNLDPEYEAFLQGAADNNINLLFSFAGYGGGFVGMDGNMTSTEIVDALSGEYLDKLQSGWTQFGAWLEKNPEVKDQVVGLELINEPASYDRAMDLAAKEGNPDPTYYTNLYAEHMAETGKLIQKFYDGDIYVDGWGWGGSLKPLAQENEAGVSAIDTLRETLGEDLVWSLHQYPDWGGKLDSGRDDRIDGWEEERAIAGDNPIVLTETNSPGYATNDVDNDALAPFQHSRIFDYFAENDIGMAWFPGHNFGQSGPVHINGKGAITLKHQDSYAAAINGFTSDSDSEGDGTLRLIDATLVNEQNARDYNADAPNDLVTKIGLGLGGDGSDAINGSELANNFIFGQDGNDVITGSINDDFLYGQKGNDVLNATGKITIADGGKGNDTLNLRDGEVVATGGEGNDTFRALGAKEIHIADFNSDTDMLSVGDLFADIEQLKAGITVTPGDTKDHPGDLVIKAPNGVSITMLRAGNLADNPETWVEEFMSDEPAPEEVEPSAPNPPEEGESGPDDIPKGPVDLEEPEETAPEYQAEDDDGGGGGGAGAAMAGLGLAGAVLMALASSGGMF